MARYRSRERVFPESPADGAVFQRHVEIGKKIHLENGHGRD